jgi:hypothetical protein
MRCISTHRWSDLSMDGETERCSAPETPSAHDSPVKIRTSPQHPPLVTTSQNHHGQILSEMSDASSHETKKGQFAPKTAVELAPPKDDPITVDYLSKCDGTPPPSLDRRREALLTRLMYRYKRRLSGSSGDQGRSACSTFRVCCVR